MAEVVRLGEGERPCPRERYALVYVSSTPPVEGAAIAAHEFGQTFFADEDEHDISIIVGRAMVWARENRIAKVYVQRNRH
jgi:hypothetical protein